MIRVRIFRSLFYLLSVCSLVACNIGGVQPRETDVSAEGSATVPATLATATSLPTHTTTPTPTDTPTPTLTPTRPLLVLTGTPLPPDLAPITLERAPQVSALAEWREPTLSDFAWTPDEHILAVSVTRKIQLYDIQTLEVLRTLYPVRQGIVDIAFSPKGTWLVAGSRRGSEQRGYASSLELWRGPDWKPMGILYGEASALAGMAFSADGKLFATAFANRNFEQNRVDIWNTVTWTITRTLQTGTVFNVAFSPDNRLLASSPERYAIRIWDLEKGEWLNKLATSFTGAVTRMAFSPDGLTLATGHYDGTIRLWDVRSGETVLLFKTEEVIESLAFSPDGRILASGGSYHNHYVHLWDANTGELLHTLKGHTAGVICLLFSPASQYLVSGSYDGVLRLWGIRP